jgi:RHH-type transcriptional regulator, rel operon repressor / antitoxin RelB
MNKTMISARVPERLSNELDQLATATNRSKAFLVTEALEQYVERNAWHVAQIDEAVKEADESGEFVSHDAMKAWLQSWGRADELPPPEPDIVKRRS